MKVLLDTNIIIDHLRKTQRVKDCLQQLLLEDAALYGCDIVIAELIAGMKASEEIETNEFLHSIEYIPMSYTIAYHAGKIKNSLSLKGITISLSDALIAAVAKGHGMILLTSNQKDFQNVSGLKTASPPTV